MSIFIAETAKVEGAAMICDNARIDGNAYVGGKAWVMGNAVVRDNALVKGNTLVFGHCILERDVTISSGNIWDLHWWREVP